MVGGILFAARIDCSLTHLLQEQRIGSAINTRELRLPLLVSANMQRILEEKFQAYKGQPLDRKRKNEIFDSFDADERKGWKSADIMRWFRVSSSCGANLNRFDDVTATGTLRQ